MEKSLTLRIFAVDLVVDDVVVVQGRGADFEGLHELAVQVCVDAPKSAQRLLAT